MEIPTPASIDPKLWGRGAWEFLDMIMVMYPINDPPAAHRDAVVALLENLHHFLPCPECRRHYQQFLLTHPVGDAVLGRNALLAFYYQLRLDVARNSNQPLPIASPQDLWQQIAVRFQLPMNRLSSRLHGERRNIRPSRSGCACGR